MGIDHFTMSWNCVYSLNPFLLQKKTFEIEINLIFTSEKPNSIAHFGHYHLQMLYCHGKFYLSWRFRHARHVRYNSMIFWLFSQLSDRKDFSNYQQNAVQSLPNCDLQSLAAPRTWISARCHKQCNKTVPCPVGRVSLLNCNRFSSL